VPPALTLRWSDEAVSDLVEIVDYIDQRNPTAATTLHEAVQDAVHKLPAMPHLFRPGRVTGTRERVVHPNYIVVYQIGDTTITVLRILHARQKYP
jgi:toxin ParE1/3/4